MWNNSWPERKEERKKRLTIFRRLILSYLLIFSLVSGMVVYAVFQFQRLNSIAAKVQKSDRSILDYGEKLADILLSEIRYEKKFIITRAAVDLDQFEQFARDFAEYFSRLELVAKYPEFQEVLFRVNESHRRYQYLFGQEVKYLKSGRDYAQNRYQREKERAVDAATEALEQVVTFAQENIHERLTQIESATAKSRTVLMAFTVLFLLLGVVVSFLITRSITQPILVLKEKTKDIAEGNLNGDLDLPAIPEIREVAETFNLMCDKLRNLDRMKAEFFFSMSKKLSTPLTSIKERIDVLTKELDGIATSSLKLKMAILREESAHLIGVVNSMVELSKTESGMMTYQFEPTAMAALIDQTLKDVAPLAEMREIAIKNEGCDSLPNIKMDSAKINQVLRTLIGNALKLTAKGGSVTISSRAVDQGIQVSIAGTKLEAPGDKFAPLFDVPEASNGTTEDNGIELGLVLAKHIIHSHGGSLCIESNTFSFVLPS
jgi:two-component system sensor histidine kinase GlrK